MAAQEGKVDVVRLLTEAEAQINIQSKVNVHIVDVLSILTGRARGRKGKIRLGRPARFLWFQLKILSQPIRLQQRVNYT